MPIIDTAVSGNTSDAVYHSMRECIVSAEWEPGRRLVHRQLAGQFGTSNIPVLEALRRLESDGLVSSYPNAGARVREWTEDDIQETFLAREALEGVTCRLFVERAARREKARLKDLSEKFDDACKAKDCAAICQADVAFHLYIAGSYNATAASSSPLFRLVQNSCLLTATIKNVHLERPNVGPVGVHDSLVDALCSDDPDLAERVGREHVRGSLDYAEKFSQQ